MGSRVSTGIVLLVAVLLSARPGAVAATRRGPVRLAADRSGDIVVRAADISQSTLHGMWTLASDSTSPEGIKLSTPAAEWATLDEPVPEPQHYFDIVFEAPANTPYRLWLRLATAGDGPSHDSVWVQFSDAEIDAMPAYRIGTRDGLLVKLDGCTGCGSPGWGWRDSSSGLQQRGIVSFASSGQHRLRIQVREDGVQLDQIVLSPRTYLNAAPGASQGDRTMLARTDRRGEQWRESR